MDALLIINDPADAAARARLEQHVRIVQEGSPRVVIVQGDPKDVEAATQAPEVLSADEFMRRKAAGSDVVPLTNSEALFVQSWVANRGPAAKGERRGAGLPWDAPGFEPP